MKENIPKYLSIRNYILDNIDADKYDDKIESEHELCQLFDASRMTVRKALSQLVLENVLYTKEKKGVYVKKRSAFKNFDGLSSFSEDAKAKNKTAAVRVISVASMPALPKLRQIMQLDASDPVWNVVRVRFLDDRPVAYEDSYINACLVKIIAHQQASQSLFDYFEEELGLKIDYAEQEIDACLADELLAGHLDIDVGAPLLRVLQTVYANDQQCIEYGYTYYRVDAYTFTQVAYRKKHRR